MDTSTRFPRLMTINSPAELRLLAEDELPQLATEIRQFMIEALDKIGGHFGGSMGTVELAIALHYIYNTPDDRLIWDVGHQAHPHRILTGRRDQLHTLKQTRGIAPFPTRSESEYDSFGVGHSSTSIGAALGMAVGAELNHTACRAIAIIGDGGLTGGMAFEALNHAGALDPNLLVILNDNEMSISENVGALTSYLGRVLSSKLYANFREGSKKILEKVPPISHLVKRTETHLKGLMVPGSLFEELGFNYVGPIDGHDLPTLLKTLTTLKDLQGAKLLHVITTKGKGYAPAEAEQIKYHAVKPGFHSKTSSPANEKKSSYSDIFGQWLCDTAAKDPKCVGITPAMREGSGMVEFSKRFPDRYFDVSIAEQHSVTFAAGLACEGLKPVVAIYSTFLQRAYDQLIHDVALQELDVTFALDRASLVADGPTHAGIFDYSFLRCIPNMVIMAPADENECRQMLSTAYQYNGPASVRYPRGGGPGVSISEALTTLPIGKGTYCHHGEKIAILAFGSMVSTATQVGQALNATVINMRFIKPLDGELIKEVCAKHDAIITLEENVIAGGAGSAVSEFLASHQLFIPILHLGLPDEFPTHGNPNDLLISYGLDAKSIHEKIQSFIKKLASTTC